jgi:hypothetical protein
MEFDWHEIAILKVLVNRQITAYKEIKTDNLETHIILNNQIDELEQIKGKLSKI